MQKVLKLTLIALVTVVLVLGFPQSIQAFEFGVTDEQTGNLSLTQSVNDNYFAFGNLVTLNGNIAGDLISMGNTIEINGDVDGNVFIGANTVVINGKVNRDVFAGVQSLKIGKDAVIGGDLVTGANSLSVEGEVKGKIRSSVASLTINGKVGKDVQVGAGVVTVGPTAIINGNLIYTSDQDAKIDSAAKITGKTERKIASVREKGGKYVQRAKGSFLGLLTALLVGIVLLFLLPKKSEQIANNIRSGFWKSLGLGFLTLIVVPFTIIIMFAIVIALPLALICLALYLFALYLTKIFTGLALGQWLSKNQWSPIWSMTIGVVILTILGLIPYLNGLVGLVVILVGLGAIITVFWPVKK